MISREFLSEAELKKYESYIDPGIYRELYSKGYKSIGKRGIDQAAFLEPDTGLILKIFGTDLYATSKSDLTTAQKSFKTFYELVKQDPNNEFLPQIFDYEQFIYKDKPYLQIRMERLFPFEGKDISDWKNVLSWITTSIKRGISPKQWLNNAFGPFGKKSEQQIIMHLGEEGFLKLWNTIVNLKQVAKKNNYYLDLEHEANFMLGSDGTPVIVDPFLMRTIR